MAVGFLIMVPAVQGAQQSRWTPSKALSSDVSTDGNATFNTTSGGIFRVNNSPVSLGTWDGNYLGNLTPPTLTDYRTWTLPDASGTVLLGPAPSFTDYSSAQHDHLDADDAGTLSADAIASGELARARLPSATCYEDDCALAASQTTTGTFDRARLPTAICYEDEACTMLVRQAFQDGFTAALNTYFDGAAFFNKSATHNGYTYVASPNLFQSNGTLVGKTNSYLEGPATVNNTLTVGQTLTVSAGGASIATGGAVPLTLTRTAVGGVQLQIDNVVGSADGRWDPTVANSGFCFFYRTSGDVLTRGVCLAPDGRFEMEGALDHDGTTMGFFGTAPATQCSAIADPSGGLTVDSQARTAIVSLITALERFGICATV